MPSIDVAIPNYEYGRYLRQCVQSVLSQDVQDLRLLIIDNASTDDSVAIARQLASKDSRIQVVVHPTNLGQVSSYNEAIDWASSKYFIILCADDLLAPGSLARAIAVMEDNPEVVLALGDVVLFYTDESPSSLVEPQRDAPWRISTGRQFVQDRCREPLQATWANFAVVRTSIQKQVGHFRTSAGRHFDYEMMLRIANLGSVAETRAFQGFWRQHEAQLSNDLGVVSLLRAAGDSHESFFSHEGRSIPQAAKLRRLALRNLGARAYWLGVANLLRSNVTESGYLLKLAFSVSPRTAVIPPLAYLWRWPNSLAKASKIIAEAFHRNETQAGRPAKHGH
jgi:glycosyltransferase involved in cell wall biosynthesis